MEVKLGQSKETPQVEQKGRAQIENKGKWHEADSEGTMLRRSEWQGGSRGYLDGGVGLLKLAVTALKVAVSALLCTGNPCQLIPLVTQILLQLLHSPCHSGSACIK